MKLSSRIKQKLVGINFSSVAFFAVSIISITLAWFAYTNSVTSNMNINLKSWDVKVKKGNTEFDNTFTINIDDLYPGMSDFSDTYTIHNNGDLDAKITYNIKYFRLFDEEEVTTTNGISFAQLSRDYPFVLNFTHGSRFLEAGSNSSFTVSCTWPFDSGNDALDTQYGQLAYDFYQHEQELHAQNSSYIMRPGLELKVEIVISQYIDETSSFSTDSWDTIELAVEKGDTSKYNIGDTKTVSVNGTNHTVRLVNKDTVSGCSITTNSQTACGFVVEFTDIITTMKMNDIITYVGGYPATNVYTYLNTTLESQLPIALQNVLGKTRVISGHGSSEPSNFRSDNQKLYLLSGKEIYGSDSFDTAASNTVQLAYYSNNSVTTSTNYSYAKKQYNGSYSFWWLRPAYSRDSRYFRVVDPTGTLNRYDADLAVGVSPAFRIA